MVLKVFVVLTAFVSIGSYGGKCPTTKEEWTKGVIEVNAQFLEYTSLRNFTRLFDLYTDDFRVLPVGEQAITTFTDLQHLAEKGIAYFSRSEIEALEILDARSDQAIAYYLAKGFDYDGKLAEVAKDVTIFKCVDGKLKIYLDIWTPNTLSDHLL